MTLLRVLNRVVDDPSLLVKLEDEQARKLLVWPLGVRNNILHLLHCLAGLPTLLFRLAARLPPHYQLLVAHMR